MHSKLTPGLWKHHTRPNQFCLVVDDFGIKYIGWENAKHSKQIQEETYKITTDWGGGICWTHMELGLQKQRCPPIHAGVCTKSTHANSIINNHGNHNVNHTPMSPKTMEQKFNMNARRHSSIAKPKTNKIHTRDNQNVLLLCPSGGHHNAYHPQCPCHGTDKTNNKNSPTCKTIS